MVQILEPLEIADGNTTCVTEDIRKELVAFGKHDLFGFESGGSICSFNNELGLEFVGIGLVNGLFQGCWDEDIS